MTGDPRYPIGPFAECADSTDVRLAALADLESLPRMLRAVVGGLTDRQLETPYRPGGWNVRQVVHHLADSHMNGLIRTKLALTEDSPAIKPYDEAAWARLADTKLPIEVSLGIIDGVHSRWVGVLRSLSPEQLQRTFLHPEHGRRMTIAYQMQNYAWHGRHHVAHITTLQRREGW